MDIKDTRKSIIIIILLLILVCIWIIFLIGWYPSIKEVMMNEMNNWTSCGIGIVKK